MDHHQALLVGCAVGLAGWLGAARVFGTLWSEGRSPSFAEPRREVALAILACGVIVAVGQAYVHGYRLRAQGWFEQPMDAINHIVIFSPIFLLLAIRQQGMDTAWLPVD